MKMGTFKIRATLKRAVNCKCEDCGTVAKEDEGFFYAYYNSWNELYGRFFCSDECLENWMGNRC